MVKFALFCLAIACLMAGVGLLLRAYDKKCGGKKGGKGGRKRLLAFSAMAMTIAFVLIGSTTALAQDPLRGLTAEEVRLLHNEDADGNQLPPGEADRQLKAIYTPEFWAREQAIVTEREAKDGGISAAERSYQKALSDLDAAVKEYERSENHDPKAWDEVMGKYRRGVSAYIHYMNLIYDRNMKVRFRAVGRPVRAVMTSAPQTVCDGNTCRVVNDGPPAAGACSSGSCAAGPVRRVFANQPVRGALRRIFCR